MKILDIILVVCAIVMIYRLYSTLGKRTENDDRHERAKSPWSSLLPKRYKPKKHPKEASVQLNAPLLEEPAFEGSHKRALKKIAQEANNFTLKGFLNGAQSLYEKMLFALNDKNSSFVEHFSVGVARAHFNKILSSKTPKGSQQKLEIIAIDEPTIQGALYKEGKAYLDVLLGCRYLAFTETKKGKVTDGSKTTQATTKDIWTFTKEVKDPSTSWLVETITPYSPVA